MNWDYFKLEYWNDCSNNTSIIMTDLTADWEENEKTVFNTNKLEDLSSLIRDLTLSFYDKYWEDNYYVVKWRWHKEDDIWLLLYEYQIWYYEKEEFIKYVRRYLDEWEDKWDVDIAKKPLKETKEEDLEKLF